MDHTRRDFIGVAALGGAGVALASIGRIDSAFASKLSASFVPEAGVERIAAAEGSLYRAYRSRAVNHADAASWVQIDLGSSRSIDAVKLYPSKTHLLSGEGFPLRFRIECSDDPAFDTRQLIKDCSRSDYPDPGDRVVQFRGASSKGRYVRLTATRLRPMGLPAILFNLPKPMLEPIQQSVQALYMFALAKIEVLSGGADLALRRPVSVDAVSYHLYSCKQSSHRSELC